MAQGQCQEENGQKGKILSGGRGSARLKPCGAAPSFFALLQVPRYNTMSSAASLAANQGCATASREVTYRAQPHQDRKILLHKFLRKWPAASLDPAALHMS